MPEADKKFSNFLESLIKYHNLLLINCLSEFIERKRTIRLVLPWDNKFDSLRFKDQKSAEKDLKEVINESVNLICGCAFMRVGQFYRNIENDGVQEERLLRSISMDYKHEGTDWSIQYEYLELRMDLTKEIEEMILDEVMTDIGWLI